MGRIIGIDLGTTNSLAAVWENGESKLIPNSFGEVLTPSVVSIDENGVLYVGKTAKERKAAYPDQTVSVFKRFMGSKKKYTLQEKEYSPEELSSMVLRRLKEDAENYLGEPVTEAVISVPAYFNDVARTATKRAGVLAGLKVERIINEPSAAALACHREKGEDQTFVVFDFGGGTLDVSLVDCFDNVVEILAVSGNNRLGGQDFDDMLAKYFIQSAKPLLTTEQITETTIEIVRRSAEQCKKKLTQEKSALMVVNCEQISHQIEITRKDLVEICGEIFTRMSRPVSQVMLDGKVRSDSIDEVILVGGSCKMPVVKQYLEHIFNRRDIQVLNPDHMIALGCGIYAGIKERNEEIKDILLTDICPFSLGTNVRNELDRNKPFMDFIIPRNTALPISREEIYYNSVNGQKKIRLGIYQGEAPYAKDNKLLGEMEFKIPPRPAGEVEVCLRYTYDINGILEVDAYIPLTKERKQKIIINEELNVSEEEITKKLIEFEQLKKNPEKEEENQYTIAWGERLYAQLNGEVKEEVRKKLNFFSKTLQEDPYRIEKVRKYLNIYFAYLEEIIGNYLFGDREGISDGSWYEDEDDREIDELFREWDGEE